MVDTTFAPGSQVMAQYAKEAPDLPIIAFISLSKSASRGRTTGGALVANHVAMARDVRARAAAMGASPDTIAKADQLRCLVDNHVGVEARCAAAYSVARRIGDVLCDAVREGSGRDMRLAFVSRENAACGFTSSTFSFNLPKPEGATAGACAALAQRFVDLITASAQFKPCVSFGQDNGLVYCTVPATSTQASPPRGTGGAPANGRRYAVHSHVLTHSRHVDANPLQLCAMRPCLLVAV